MRKISIIALLLALTMIFAGCSNLITVNEERDMQRVVIKVDGNEITKQEYAYMYFSFMDNYGISEKQVKEDEDTRQTLKDGTITQLVNNEILLIKANEYDCYNFTQEEHEDLTVEYEKLIQRYRDLSESNVKAKNDTENLSQEEIDKLIKEDLAETFQQKGLTEEIIKKKLEDEKAFDKLSVIITETTAPTESEIQSAYDLKIIEQQSNFNETPSNYESYVKYGYTIYYNLPGARNAQRILISLPTDIQSQISDFRSNNDNESADLLLKEELAKIKETADKVYNLAVEGADFNELITEYGQDPNMTEDSYYTVINPSQSFDPDFVAGLFSLNNVGKFTQPISSDLGYQIILYTGDVKEGPVALEDVKEGIIEELNYNKENELINTQMEEWNEQAKIKIYDSRLDLDLD